MTKFKIWECIFHPNGCVPYIQFLGWNKNLGKVYTSHYKQHCAWASRRVSREYILNPCCLEQETFLLFLFSAVVTWTVSCHTSSLAPVFLYHLGIKLVDSRRVVNMCFGCFYGCPENSAYILGLSKCSRWELTEPPSTTRQQKKAFFLEMDTLVWLLRGTMSTPLLIPTENLARLAGFSGETQETDMENNWAGSELNTQAAWDGGLPCWFQNQGHHQV